VARAAGPSVVVGLARSSRFGLNGAALRPRAARPKNSPPSSKPFHAAPFITTVIAASIRPVDASFATSGGVSSTTAADPNYAGRGSSA